MTTIDKIQDILVNAKHGQFISLDCRGDDENFDATVIQLGSDQVQHVKAENWQKGWPTPTARDYVQDGLIYHLDCLENIGYGSFSSEASTWTNLAGTGNDAILNNKGTYLYWTDCGLVSNQYSNNNSYAYLPTGAIPTTTRTIEMIVDVTYAGRYGRWLSNNDMGGGSSNNVMMSWGNVAGESSAPVISLRFGDGQINIAQTMYTNKKYSLGFAFSSITDFILYTNDDATSTTTYNTWTSLISSSQQVFLGQAIRSGNVQFNNQIIYGLRIYDHKLTEAERANNYTIDKQRFNIE